MGITCKEIAEKLGISRQAVYSVLSNKAVCHVSAEKRDKILYLAKLYHYQPNIAAIRLNGKPTRIIGIIADGYWGPGGRRNFAVSELLEKQGYSVLSEAAVSTPQMHQSIARLAGLGAAGIFYPYYMLYNLRSEEIPVPSVAFDGEAGFDAAAGMELLARHLVEVHGHKRILLCRNIDVPNPVAPGEYYDRSMEKLGLEKFPIFYTGTGNEFLDQLPEQIKQNGITAVIAYGEGAHMIHALRLRGIRVPEDVTVVSCHDGAEAPEITSIARDIAKEAELLVETLLEKIENGHHDALSVPRLAPPAGLRLGVSCGCLEYGREK